MAAGDPIPVAPHNLPPPNEQLAVLPSTSGRTLEFVLPPNLEGQAPDLRPGRRPAAAAATATATAATAATSRLPLIMTPVPTTQSSAHQSPTFTNPQQNVCVVLSPPSLSGGSIIGFSTKYCCIYVLQQHYKGYNVKCLKC